EIMARVRALLSKLLRALSSQTRARFSSKASLYQSLLLWWLGTSESRPSIRTFPWLLILMRHPISSLDVKYCAMACLVNSAFWIKRPCGNARMKLFIRCMLVYAIAEHPLCTFQEANGKVLQSHEQ